MPKPVFQCAHTLVVSEPVAADATETGGLLALRGVRALLFLRAIIQSFGNFAANL